MPARTEDQPSLRIAHRAIVRIDGNGIGRGALYGKFGLDTYMVCAFGFGRNGTQQGFEERLVLGRNGKVQADFPRSAHCVFHPFGQMLLGGFAHFVRIPVEGDQPFGQLSVTQPFGGEDLAYDVDIVPLGQAFFEVVPASGIDSSQLVEEGKPADVLKKLGHPGQLALLDELLERKPAGGVFLQKDEKVLEHAGSCSAGRDEFQYVQAGRTFSVEAAIMLGLGGIHPYDTVPDGSRSGDVQRGEALAEAFHLAFYLLGGDAFFPQLFEILFGE